MQIKLFKILSNRTLFGYQNSTRIFSFSLSMDVIILGCGLAGLGAAHKLMHNGLKVCILEAQGKAGGRVKTIEIKAFNNIIENCKEVHKIEAGAQ